MNTREQFEFQNLGYLEAGGQGSPKTRCVFLNPGAARLHR